MKKDISVIIIVLFLLIGISTNLSFDESDSKADLNKLITLNTAEHFTTHNGEFITFYGYVNKLEEGWVISLSDRYGKSIVNEYYIVNVGQVINLSSVQIKIIKLEPQNNQIQFLILKYK